MYISRFFYNCIYVCVLLYISSSSHLIAPDAPRQHASSLASRLFALLHRTGALQGKALKPGRGLGGVMVQTPYKGHYRGGGNMGSLISFFLGGILAMARINM